MEEVQKPARKIGVGYILGWLIGFLFIAGGFSMVVLNATSTSQTVSPMLGFIYVIAGLVVFPPFWSLIKSQMNFELSRTLKIILFFLILFLGPVLTVKSSLTNQLPTVQNTKEVNAPVQQVVVATPTPLPEKLTAQQMVDDFDKNKLAAEDKYKSKYVEFSAKIKNISNDVLGTPYLSLEPPSAGEYYFGTTLTCHFNTDTEPKTLENGSTVLLRGTVSGMTLGIITIKDCSVVR